jgi:hypothetical protein
MNNDVQSPFPKVTKSLIKSLEEIFPKKDFNTETTLRELDYHYGQRSVVNFLRLKLEEQSENIL